MGTLYVSGFVYWGTFYDTSWKFSPPPIVELMVSSPKNLARGFLLVGQDLLLLLLLICRVAAFDYLNMTFSEVFFY